MLAAHLPHSLRRVLFVAGGTKHVLDRIRHGVLCRQVVLVSALQYEFEVPITLDKKSEGTVGIDLKYSRCLFDQVLLPSEDLLR